MKLTITYCAPCGYKSRAVKTQAALKSKLNVDAELIAGDHGIFEVAVDGKVAAAKTKFGFPSEEQILEGVNRMSAP